MRISTDTEDRVAEDEWQAPKTALSRVAGARGPEWTIQYKRLHEDEDEFEDEDEDDEDDPDEEDE